MQGCKEIDSLWRKNQKEISLQKKKKKISLQAAEKLRRKKSVAEPIPNSFPRAPRAKGVISNLFSRASRARNVISWQISAQGNAALNPLLARSARENMPFARKHFVTCSTHDNIVFQRIPRQKGTNILFPPRDLGA